MHSPLAKYVSMSDMEREGMQRLSKAVRDYYSSGADDETTLARNLACFNRLVIRPLALRDVSNCCDMSVRLQLRGRNGDVCYDQQFKFPIGIAPTAFQKMAHPEGELATARAARDTKTLLINSTLSTTRLEDVAAAVEDGFAWFQLYVYKDRQLTQSLVNRAEKAGFRALVLTVDAPIFGRRRADERNAFALPPHLELANFAGTSDKATIDAKHAGRSGLADYVRELFDASLNWDDLRWLVNLTTLPVLVKGIMRGDDARMAIEHGAAGVIVSNHGGRQLDHAPATIEVLPEVVAAVGGRVPVLLDGGIRCGADVLKSLALGADHVFIGRPTIYGLAVGGAEGVKHVLGLLRSEFDHAMRLSGCPTIADLRRNERMVVHESVFAKL